jgi:phosphoserine aminotransferase
MDMTMTRPGVRPAKPYFSSGPCSKHPGWSLQSLKNAYVGRSHRAKAPKARLKQLIDLSREVLQIPADYRIGIMPGSDTGAVEAALWSMLGARGVDVLAWDSFGEIWVADILKELKIWDARTMVAEYGSLPDLSQVNFDHDVVFTWNGTTAGLAVPDADWIPADRAGLTICDATSAAFAHRLDWAKLDVVTFSWQKMLGSEAAHGMIVLSPRAVERLETYSPPWPIPKLFRLSRGGELFESIFEGETINTVSMLCVEDCVDALRWAKSIGGLDGMIGRAEANCAALAAWVERTPWIDFVIKDPNLRAKAGMCLKIVDPEIAGMPVGERAAFIRGIIDYLDDEGAAYDIGSYRDAPPGFRIWCGSTVDVADLEALTQWLDYAFARAKEELAVPA